MSYSPIDSGERVSTGIIGLDQAIQGGFSKGKTYLLCGSAGTGKSIFGLQFIWAGLLAKTSCVYISAGETPADLIIAARTLGWEIDTLKEHLMFLDISPYLVNATSGRRNRPATASLDRLMTDLSAFVKRKQATRLVIDSADLLLNNDSWISDAAFARELVLATEKRLDCTTVMTLNGVDHPLEHFVSGVFHLELVRKSGEYKRLLTVKKMRATAIQATSYHFEITKFNGISLIDAKGTNGDSANDREPKPLRSVKPSWRLS